MTEDVKPQEGQQEEQVEQREYSDVEKQAMEKGWKPKEEYQGDPDRWRSAEVFVALDEPLKRIEHQSKELKAVRAALEAFKEHHNKVKETEFNRAVKSLQDARKKAIIDGDAETALAIEERVDEIKAEKAEFEAEAKKPAVQPTPELNPEFQSWINKNSWYTSNRAMRAVADRIGIELHQEGHSPSEVLNLVEKEVRKEFPHKFENDKGKRSMAVEPSSRSSRSSNDSYQLDDQERDAMRKFVKNGIMTEKEYIAELKRVKGA